MTFLRPMIGNSHTMTKSIFQISKFNTSMVQSQWTVFQLVNIQLDIHSFCKKNKYIYNIICEVSYFSDLNSNAYELLKNIWKIYSVICFCQKKKNYNFEKPRCHKKEKKSWWPRNWVSLKMSLRHWKIVRFSPFLTFPADF